MHEHLPTETRGRYKAADMRRQTSQAFTQASPEAGAAPLSPGDCVCSRGQRVGVPDTRMKPMGYRSTRWLRAGGGCTAVAVAGHRDSEGLIPRGRRS